MTTTETPPNTRMDGRHHHAVAELQAVLPGQVRTADDPAWEAVSQGWNVAVPQRPLAVVTVKDADDVAAAVVWARRHDLAVSVQPVGHGATTALDGTVLLRTGDLQQLEVDPGRRTARVGAGVKWGTLLAALEPTGLLALAGSSPDPTVVGYLLGGGVSWFGRAFGLAAHDITAVELVDGDGEVHRVTAQSDPDLFWALRGGGGGLGVVTAIELRLHEAPPVYGGRLLWPLEMARPVLQEFRRVTASAPDALTLWAHLLRFPPVPELPEEIRGRSFVSVDLTHLGAPDEAESAIAGLRAVPGLVSDSVRVVPLGELGSICAEPVDPMPTRETGRLLHGLDAATMDRLVDAAAGQELPLAVVQLRHLGGAFARASATDGPVGALEEEYALFCLGVPATPGAARAIDDAVAEVLGALGPVLSERRLYNFLGGSTDPRAAFGRDALHRLRVIKRAADPQAVFRTNRPLEG